MSRTEAPPQSAGTSEKPHAWPVIRRVAISTFNDGFIHAGNLAYLSMLAIFPFFILGAALFDIIGGRENAETIIFSVARALPSSVATVIVPVAETVIMNRSGWLLWAGALFTAAWWLAVAAALPVVLRGAFSYDVTYGSLAGSIVTLLFFWLVGLGLVIGAQLNAALALESLLSSAELPKE